ncbi:MAG: DNA polymerase III subunit delta [Pseudomonadota bacterium]
MKLKGAAFVRGVPREAREAGLFFFCGPDEAGASAAAEKTIAALPDAGERIELSGGDLKRDAALLGDEARTDSLFGDKRHIYVRASGDEAHDALKALIETGDAGAGEAAPVFIVATSATDKSRTAKLLEKRGDALVCMFHPPELRDVVNAVRAMADGAGLRLNGSVAEQIAQGAGLDVRLAQSEIDKLALYCDAAPQSPKPAGPEDYEQIGAATEEDGFQPLVNAVLGGNLEQLPSELKRMRELGLNPVGLLLAIERRANMLVQIAGKVGPGGQLDRLSQIEERQLGVFWKEKPAIGQQFARWNRPAARNSAERRLDRLVPRLIALHNQLLANSQAAPLLLSQELTQIARFAARG